MRVHGGEGCLGTVGVHTPHLPNSLAWLSPNQELTFGELDQSVQLRWFTLGMHTSNAAAVGVCCCLCDCHSIGNCTLDKSQSLGRKLCGYFVETKTFVGKIGNHFETAYRGSSEVTVVG